MLYKLEIRSKLLLSGQNSVDAFLETYNACLDIGKAAMAAVLLQYESQEVFGWLELTCQPFAQLFSQRETVTTASASSNYEANGLGDHVVPRRIKSCGATARRSRLEIFRRTVPRTRVNRRGPRGFG